MAKEVEAKYTGQVMKEYRPTGSGLQRINTHI